MTYEYIGYGVVGLIIITEFALLLLVFPKIKKDDDDGSAHK